MIFPKKWWWVNFAGFEILFFGGDQKVPPPIIRNIMVYEQSHCPECQYDELATQLERTWNGHPIKVIDEIFRLDLARKLPTFAF